MKSSSKTKSKALSMKDALSGFGGLRVAKEDLKKKDFREFIWNYPVNFVKLVKRTVPLSYIFFALIFACSLALILQSKAFSNSLQHVEESSDTYTEGMVGAVSSLNPLFVSANYVDKAIQSLIYSKFVYIDSNGDPEPGIAKSWSVSNDSLEYTFKIGDDYYWQDGSALTIDDVLFTFNTAISLYNNGEEDSVGAALSGVELTKVDDHTIRFKLSEANPTFFDAVSMYIVSKTKLESISSLSIRDVKPFGSGKYFIDKEEQNAVYLSDNPYDAYEPNLTSLVMRIYPDYEDLQTAVRVGDVDACGSLDSTQLAFMQEYSAFDSLVAPERYRNRILFFNVRKDGIDDTNLRIGLSYLLDKESLLKDSGISGVVMNGPLPESSWAYDKAIDYYQFNVASAEKYLKKAGYTKNTETGYYESEEGNILSFALSYYDNEINDRLVNSLVELLDSEGVVITLQKYSYDEITQQVIATRDFELLLYEVETTVDPDQYNLWHSTKVDYPNLNLSGYKNDRVDILLEEARKTTNKTSRKTDYQLFQKYLMEDAPAIFLYHPSYTFYFDARLKGIDISNINFSYERYWNIEDWYWNK